MYLSRINYISSVADVLNILTEVFLMLYEEQHHMFSEFITVIDEVRRVARQREAHRKVSMYQTPRLLRELHETILIMGGDLLPAVFSRN